MEKIAFSAKTIELLKYTGWWLLLIVCAIYAGFALDMFRMELMSHFEATDAAEMGMEIKVREAPVIFLMHALLGSIGLVCGVLQFNKNILKAKRQLHRIIGWTYLVTIWGASLSGIWNTFYFDVPNSAKVIFCFIGAWWFISTSIAYLRIRSRQIQSHRDWMIRSFAMSLFFISFPIWVPSYQSFLPDEIAWPLGLFQAGFLNIAISELWIRSLNKQALPA